jgi:DNA-binding HxlR family transcriptional regulator
MDGITRVNKVNLLSFLKYLSLISKVYTQLVRNVFLEVWHSLSPKLSGVMGNEGVFILMDVKKTLFEDQDRVSKGLLKVLARSGVSSILLSLEIEPRRFSQLMFESQLNPGVLSRHLKALQDFAVIEKSSDTYQLTDRGKKVVKILRAIFEIS